MRFPWERDLRRTCAKCGETWVVPYLLRRQKLDSWRKAARSSARAPAAERLRKATDPWRKQHAMYGVASARAEEAEEERKLIASLARCSACLSTDYTDAPIK